MTQDTILQAAAETGFTKAAVISTEDIIFEPTFRFYCEQNSCGQYDASYACPPACGTPEEMKAKLMVFKQAVVLQTTREVPDYTDYPALIEANMAHKAGELELLEKIRADGHKAHLVSASGCFLCNPCKYKTGEPCPFPDKRHSCMSAYCIFVQDLAQKCGMDYTWKESTLSFYGMIAWE